MNLQEIRQKYPGYDDMDDGALASAIHRKFYPDMPFDDFAGRIGYMTPDRKRLVDEAGRKYRENMGVADKVAEFMATNPVSRGVGMGLQGVANASLNPAGYVARAMGMDTKPLEAENAAERAIEWATGTVYDTIPIAIAGGALAASKPVQAALSSGSKVIRYPAKAIYALAKPQAMKYEVAGAIGAGGLTGAAQPETTLGRIGVGLAGSLGGVGALGLMGAARRGLSRFGSIEGAKAIKPNSIRTSAAGTSSPIQVGDGVVSQTSVRANKRSRLTTPERLDANPNIPQSAKKALKDSAQYEQISNDALIQNSMRRVSQDGDAIRNNLLYKKAYEAQDFEDARQIASKLFAEGRDEDALNLIRTVSERGSKAGQSVQAMSLWSKMTPDGAVLHAQKMVNEFNKTNKKKISLSPEQAQRIRFFQEQAMKLPDGDARNVATALSLKAQQEVIPVNLGSKIKAYRIISLLLNPKTLGRNIVGTTVFNAVEKGSVDPLAVGIDRGIGLFTGKRTRVLPDFAEFGRGLYSGTKKGIRDVNLGINTRQLGGRFDMQPVGIFNNRIGKAFEKALAYGLQVPDRAFFEATFRESIKNQMRAQGLKKATNGIMAQAEKEALESVFQNKSLLSDLSFGARRGLNKATQKILESVGIKVSKDALGVGDILMPFPQTPANLAQQSINYSPLGFVKSFGAKSQRDLSKDLARATVGTGIMGGSAELARRGLMTGDMNPSDLSYKEALERRRNLELMGIRPNQIGGVSFGAFAPMSVNMTAGAKLAQGGTPLEAIRASAETLMDMPFAQGVSRMVKGVAQNGLTETLKNEAARVPTQFVPTAFSQFADVLDNTQRETYDPSILKMGLNQAINKVPFARGILPERKNVMGESSKKYDSEGLALVWDAMINPTFINEKKSQPVIEELNRLYQTTGEAGQFLPVVDRKISVKRADGSRAMVALEPDEYVAYQKLVGQSNVAALNYLMNTPAYYSMTDEERVKSIGDAQKAIIADVKGRLFGGQEKGKPDIIQNIQRRIKAPQNKVLNTTIKEIVNQVITNDKKERK